MLQFRPLKTGGTSYRFQTTAGAWGVLALRLPGPGVTFGPYSVLCAQSHTSSCLSLPGRSNKEPQTEELR